jgi:hypothetical protein
MFIKNDEERDANIEKARRVFVDSDVIFSEKNALKQANASLRVNIRSMAQEIDRLYKTIEDKNFEIETLKNLLDFERKKLNIESTTNFILHKETTDG